MAPHPVPWGGLGTPVTDLDAWTNAILSDKAMLWSSGGGGAYSTFDLGHAPRRHTAPYLSILLRLSLRIAHRTALPLPCDLWSGLFILATAPLVASHRWSLCALRASSDTPIYTMASSSRAIQYTIPAREDFNKLADEQKTRINEAVCLP
jgi:hypothetical protein